MLLCILYLIKLVFLLHQVLFWIAGLSSYYIIKIWSFLSMDILIIVWTNRNL